MTVVTVVTGGTITEGGTASKGPAPGKHAGLSGNFDSPGLKRPTANCLGTNKVILGNDNDTMAEANRPKTFITQCDGRG